jgi:beta-glucanase (GH16 family)
MVAVITVATLTASCTGASDAGGRGRVAELQLAALPPVSQPGAGDAPATDARPVLVATASPARAGVPVRLQRRVGSGWQNVARARTNADGLADFTEPAAGTPATRYRVVAVAHPDVHSDGSLAGRWRLDFSDEFDGTSLGSRWAYRQLGELSKASGRTVSASSERAVSVSGGALRLEVAEDPDTPGHYLNGHISTQASYSFRYGVAAARIRFQRPRGSHGAFWSQSPTFGDPPGDPAAAGTEIDVAEYFGDGYPKGGLASYVYHVAADGTNVKDGDVMPGAVRAVGSRSGFWQRYHVYSVEWSPDGYVFRIDGAVVYTTHEAVSERSQFLVLSLLSSDWELPKLDKRLLPGVMSVDWVRVWQSRA